MHPSFPIIIQTRKNFQDLIEGLSEDQVNKVPKGCNNNIIWNFGHSIMTSLVLTYGLCGMEVPIDIKFLRFYKKGSLPEEHLGLIEIESMIDLSRKTIEYIINDYDAGNFRGFSSYHTSFGVHLEDIDDALYFNASHEALHLGVAMTQAHAVK